MKKGDSHKSPAIERIVLAYNDREDGRKLVTLLKEKDYQVWR